MPEELIRIYSGGELVEAVPSISNYSIASGYTVFAYSGGTASGTAVGSGGVLEVSGGTVTDTTVKNGGVMTVNSGSVESVSVRGKLFLNGLASSIDVMGGSELFVQKGGIADDLDIYVNAKVTVSSGGLIRDSVQYGKGTTVLDGGNAEKITLKAGTLTMKNGAAASDVELFQSGVTVTVQADSFLTGTTCIGAELTAEEGATVSNTVLRGYQIYEQTDVFIGTLTLKSGSRHTGTLAISGWGAVKAEAGSVIDFTVSECTPGNKALISNFAGISGTPSFTMTVSEDQPAGTYLLAEKITAFDYTVTVQTAGMQTLGNISTAAPLVLEECSCTLVLADNTLSLVITDSPSMPHDLSGDENGVTWQGTADNFTVQYSKDNFASVLELRTDACGVDLYAMPEADYDWKVKNTAGSRWVKGDAIAARYTPGSAEAWKSDNDGLCDLFFANASGTWGFAYEAIHTGTADGWTGTLERVVLAGKNRFSDTFTGSEDANILVLTDDAGGDALFADDIYTAFPDEQQSRLAQINEIRAGSGDDVVDLTSQRFAYQGGGLVIRGGSGNDTLWAATGANILCGDAGNDRIAGAAGNDVIAGGAGDDSLHGGGGNDIFCFCSSWGSDTVEQLDGGTVTLWFSETVSLTFETVGSDTQIISEQGSVLVKNMTVTESDCRFGNTGYEEEFTRLAGQGVFLSESSTAVFAEAK